MKGPVKKYPTVGACGLDCGLCTRYYTVGNSRCPGCCGPGFFEKHPTCPFITCCVKKRKLEVCAECPEFPCARLKTTEEYKAAEVSTYPPNRRMIPNLRFIQRHGVERFIEQQGKRIEWLEKALQDFDDGRSRSFLCRAAGLLDVTALEASLKEARRKVKASETKGNDVKLRAKVLRRILDDAAAAKGIELRLKGVRKGG